MIKAIRTCAAATVSCLLFSVTTETQMSFSTDFDGRGTGTRITVDTSRLRSAGPSTPPSGTGAANVGEFLKQRYEAQLHEVQLRQDLDRARAYRNLIEIERLLALMQQLEIDEPSAVRRNSYVQQALNYERQFRAARSRYIAMLPSYRSRLAASLNHINVPPVGRPRRFASVLLWGAMSTPLEARLSALSNTRNPFSGQPFNDVLAFGSRGPDDLARVTLDHLLGQLGRLSENTREHLGALKGATVDELVCHSNGCRVAQTLIATGSMKVNRLRILGGDNVAIELGELRQLKERHRIAEVSIYLMRGDPVPLVNPGWPLFDVMRRLGQPLQTFQNSHARDATYQLLGLAPRPPFATQADVQVHTISDPALGALQPIEAHRYERYARVINGLRVSGCLEAAGTMSRKCIIQ